MNRLVNSIAGRLSLRAPQRQSLEILDRVTEIVPPRKNADLAAALATIQSEFPGVTDFEREFPSLCFALATGVGKTRLMGAFISYLHLAHGLRNFFVLAPNLTIYNKLIADFTPNTPKYVFTGVAEFATDIPRLVTGDTYDTIHHIPASQLFDNSISVNVFNISKINAEVRGDQQPRIKRLSEIIGQSYFDYLAGLSDLVLIMDESHRYRASAGVRAINELKPVLGLELTATPFIESSRGTVAFKNVILDYPLGRAMEDGFVKEPAVVTRKDFDPAGMTPEAIERLKLEDGVRLHEGIKVELRTYALQADRPVVKPFMLVIARDTTHAAQLVELMESAEFFDGACEGKVIRVDSSRAGAESDEVVQRLLRVEHADEPTEIVVHVNMLKEGWDVTNLYTIVPLRAANARTLIEQSIGRGLRLPYGKRTGVTAVDRLNIVAHDRFQEIVDEANRPDSPVRLKTVVLSGERLAERSATYVATPVLDRVLGVGSGSYPTVPGAIVNAPAPIFTDPEELKVAGVVLDEILKLERDPAQVPTIAALKDPGVQARLVDAVTLARASGQLTIAGVGPVVDIAGIVARATDAIVERSISIPRIVVIPKNEHRTTFQPFALDLSGVRYPRVSEELLAKHLRTAQVDRIATGGGGITELRDEDYIVRALVDFNDISYDDQADLLYGLAKQVVEHLRGYLTADEAGNVLRCYQREIATLVHTQMQSHAQDGVLEFEVRVSGGFSELKAPAFTADRDAPVLPLSQSPPDGSRIGRHVYGGFERCCYDLQKFDSEPERRLAVILEREAQKWFRPVLGQFRISYRQGVEEHEYQPDFVAEIDHVILMLEVKASNELQDPIVLAKRDAAVLWCRRASEHAVAHGGKPWRYALVPDDVIAENKTIDGLMERYERHAR